MTRRLTLGALFIAITAIAIGYAGAFNKSGTPMWAPWLLALGIPVALGAIMILGAARGNRGIGALTFPFAFVVLVLAAGFGAALALPGADGSLSKLWLGLPARAAIVIYGIGLLPIIILPVAYAMTFEAMTLSNQDLERVRAIGRANALLERDAATESAAASTE